MSFQTKKIYPRQYHPMLVSNDGTNDRMDSKTSLVLWETFDRLSPEVRSVVSSDAVAEKMKELQDAFQLNDTVLGLVTLLVRKIFFGELQMAECEAKIGSMLTTTNGGDPNQARAIVEFIQKEILTIQPKSAEEEKEEEKPKVTMANLPLLQALSKYENLGNQLITEERIKVKSQPEAVRPSLLYWLKYYRDELGIGQHSSVERGDFLFRSENGRKLSAPERERVNLILKSVEEDLPLSIDLERQEIIFPVFRDVVLARPDGQNASGGMPASTAYPASRDESLGGRSESANNVSPVRGNSAGSIVGEPALAWSPPAAPLASMIPRDEPIRIPGGFTPLTAERNEPFAARPVSSAPPVSSSVALPRAKAIGTPVFFVPKPEEDEVRPAQVRSAGSTAPRQNENRIGQAFGASEVSFSTGHVFPAEKEAAENRTVVTKNVATGPAQPQPVPQKFSSFRISPVSLGGRDPGDK